MGEGYAGPHVPAPSEATEKLAAPVARKVFGRLADAGTVVRLGLDLHFDAQGVTKRLGDERVLGPRA